MVFNKTEQDERRYLKKILGLINKMIKNTDISVKEHESTLREYKDYLWTNKDIDPHEIRSMRESILNHFAVGENVINKHARLTKILDNPYFGRMDFKENGNTKTVVPIYIGIHNFYDQNDKKNLIYDWRAPVSSMFYDHESGTASYHSPSGKIEGNISLKRQYRIRNGNMEFMLESSLAIHDEILQKELSRNTDDKMRNIVSTIQREQNRIIRNEDAKTLIIQGVAGSGKTSVALHRMAYLLYAARNDISSADILIVSPNKVFSDYISDVLPELGEENVPDRRMEEILSDILDNKYKYQDFFEQTAELLEQYSPDLTDRISFKASSDFARLLDRFILHVENNYFKATDMRLTKYFTVPAQYTEKLFRRFDRLPIRQRFERMAEYIVETARTKYNISVSTAEKNVLKKEIRKMFGGNSDIKLYKEFFAWTGKQEMFKIHRNNTLEYSDLAPLAYLHLSLEGNTRPRRIKHLLIDEMQDYTPIQYKVLQKLYPCKKTLLGDAGQTVNPYGSSTAETILTTFGEGEIIKLCKSYRSTYEITEFAKKIKTNDDSIAIERHGEGPSIIRYNNKEDEISGINELIAKFLISGQGTLGIICKSETQAKELYESLKTSINDVFFLSSRSTSFSKGVIVTSATMSKGLEFDEVIIPKADKTNYRSEMDRNTLYIEATRAMHRLTITYSGELSCFIPLY